MLCGTETSSELTGTPWSESISSAVASLASPSVSLGNDEDETTHAGSGLNLLGALAYYDHATCSLRMCQGFLFEDLETCSETWPRAGTMRSGIVCQQAPLVPLTRGIASGLWLTPSVEDAGREGTAEAWAEYLEDGRTTQARLRKQVMWPTPTSRD